MIFGINTTSDISKLLYVISRAVRRVKFEISRVVFMPNITYKSCYFFVYTTTRKRFVIFTCRYFKWSWNTTALSQSDCRNFSCSSIIDIFTRWLHTSKVRGYFLVVLFCFVLLFLNIFSFFDRLIIYPRSSQSIKIGIDNDQ